MALALADAGADVVAAARTQAQIDETAGLVRAKVVGVLRCRRMSQSDQSTMVDASIVEFGRIDVLVNNAGGVIGWNKPIEAIRDEQWRGGIDLNITSAFYCCRAVWPHLLRQGGGKIINVTSGVGVRAMKHNYMYATAKAGMINFTRAMAFNYADKNIQINLILPGIFPHDDPVMMQFWQGGDSFQSDEWQDDELGPACVFSRESPIT
jgi:NAD(P)-dependent dehydrogenase (short-subunit alcohol dehydrogenase family)